MDIFYPHDWDRVNWGWSRVNWGWSSIYLKIGLNWPNRQFCLAGCSKTNGTQDFDFFNCHGCQIIIFCEIHYYWSAHIFWVCCFSLSQCDSVGRVTEYALPWLTRLGSIFYFHIPYSRHYNLLDENCSWILISIQKFEKKLLLINDQKKKKKCFFFKSGSKNKHKSI